MVLIIHKDLSSSAKRDSIPVTREQLILFVAYMIEIDIDVPQRFLAKV